MTYRVIMNEDKERQLNVWVDNNDQLQCYCNCIELQVLFISVLRANGFNCDQATLNDFVKTYRELKDFCFDITNEGIKYYDLGSNAKNMAIYNGDE